MSTFIGWLGDTHIGYRQYGLESRKKDFELAMREAVTSMVSQRVDAIIHTGDLLHSNRPDPGSIKFLQEIHNYLVNHEVPMYLISGNHDASTPHWSTVANMGEVGLYGIQLMDGKQVYLANNRGDIVRIFGINFCSNDEFRASVFKPAEILVMHQAVQEFVDFESDNMLKVLDIPKSYPVVAIGDIHISDIRDFGHQKIGYAGSTEMNSDSESPDKKWALLEFEDRRLVNLFWRTIQTRKVIKLQIDTEADVEAGILKVREHVNANTASRSPIIMLETTNPDLNALTRFKTVFNPDDYIFRSHYTGKDQLVFGEVDDSGTNTRNLVLEEKIREELKDLPDMVPLATQLFNPDLDAAPVLNEFFDTESVRIGEGLL